MFRLIAEFTFYIYQCMLREFIFCVYIKTLFGFKFKPGQISTNIFGKIASPIQCTHNYSQNSLGNTELTFSSTTHAYTHTLN